MNKGLKGAFVKNDLKVALFFPVFHRRLRTLVIRSTASFGHAGGGGLILLVLVPARRDPAFGPGLAFLVVGQRPDCRGVAPRRALLTSEICRQGPTNPVQDATLRGKMPVEVTKDPLEPIKRHSYLPTVRGLMDLTPPPAPRWCRHDKRASL